MRGTMRWMRRLGPGAGVAALALAAVGVGAGPVALSGSSSQATLYPLVSQSFQGNSAGSDWSLPADPSAFHAKNAACLTEGGTPSTPSAIPQCEGASDTGNTGSLRLTSSETAQLGTVFYGSSVPTDRGLVVRFDAYQYNAGCQAPEGGTFAQGDCQGADGIGFVLAAANPADPTPPSQGGNLGGALGYGPFPEQAYHGEPAIPLPGIPDGYLGVGLDVYGNYLNPQYYLPNPADCPFYAENGLASGHTYPEEVTVKGPGNGLTGYCPIVSTYSPSSDGLLLDQPSASARPSTPVEVEVVLNPGSSSVTVPGRGGSTISVPAGEFAVQVLPYAFGPSGYSQAAKPTLLTGALPTLDDSNDYDGVPSSWVDPQTGLPYQLTFGFTGSTGAVFETHEITDLLASTISAPAPVLGLDVTDNTSHTMTVGIPTNFTFTPSVTTSGGPESQDLKLTVSFPTGITPDLAGASGTGWTCTAGASAETFACSYATPSSGIARGASAAPLTIPATASSPSSTRLVVSAKVSSTDGLPASGSDSVTVVAAPVTKTAPPVSQPTTTQPTTTQPTTQPTTTQPTTQPTTKPASVPATHTGEPWAGRTLWDAVVATMIGGGASLVLMGRRRAIERP